MSLHCIAMGKCAILNNSNQWCASKNPQNENKNTGKDFQGFWIWGCCFESPHFLSNRNEAFSPFSLGGTRKAFLPDQSHPCRSLWEGTNHKAEALFCMPMPWGWAWEGLKLCLRFLFNFWCVSPMTWGGGSEVGTFAFLWGKETAVGFLLHF